MEFRRPRICLLSLMAAVAMIALILGEVRRRHFEYLQRADWHASHAAQHHIRFGSLIGGLSWINAKGEVVHERERRIPSLKKNDWHHLMMQKYERAARYPWLPVESDPSEPE